MKSSQFLYEKKIKNIHDIIQFPNRVFFFFTANILLMFITFLEQFNYKLEFIVDLNLFVFP